MLFLIPLLNSFNFTQWSATILQVLYLSLSLFIIISFFVNYYMIWLFGRDFVITFQKGHIPFVFHLKYFLFFFVNIARCCIGRMILSPVCISNFLQAIFLHVFRALFTAFGTCVSFSKSFPVVFIFLAFEAPQGQWNVLLNPLKTIADLHFLGRVGLNILFFVGRIRIYFP